MVLQPSDNGEALLAAVETSLRELESLCGSIERALTRRLWNELDVAIADSRRVMHALQNAMDDAAGVRSAAYDETVFRRLRYVHTIRQNQMVRLQQYHDAVGERLALISRWKAAVRSMIRSGNVARLSALDGLS